MFSIGLFLLGEGIKWRLLGVWRVFREKASFVSGKNCNFAARNINIMTIEEIQVLIAKDY